MSAVRTLIVAVCAASLVSALPASAADPAGSANVVVTVIDERPESSGKRLASLKTAIPNLARVGILADPGNRRTPAYLQQSRTWAREAGVSLFAYYVNDPEDIAPAFARMIEHRIEALVVLPKGQDDKFAH